jgi:hypothetical protein
MISSEPSDSHMFMVDDLEVNNKILKSLLTSQICKGWCAFYMNVLVRGNDHRIACSKKVMKSFTDAEYLSVVSPPASIRK